MLGLRVVGNKCDLGEERKGEAEALAKDREVSAKPGACVEELFLRIRGKH
jgi:hypothetical protein